MKNINLFHSSHYLNPCDIKNRHCVHSIFRVQYSHSWKYNVDINSHMKIDLEFDKGFNRNIKYVISWLNDCSSIYFRPCFWYQSRKHIDRKKERKKLTSQNEVQFQPKIFSKKSKIQTEHHSIGSIDLLICPKINEFEIRRIKS